MRKLWLNTEHLSDVTASMFPVPKSKKIAIFKKISSSKLQLENFIKNMMKYFNIYRIFLKIFTNWQWISGMRKEVLNVRHFSDVTWFQQRYKKLRFSKNSPAQNGCLKISFKTPFISFKTFEYLNGVFISIDIFLD